MQDAERRKAIRAEEARAASAVGCSFRPAVNRSRPSSAAPALGRGGGGARLPFTSPMRAGGGGDGGGEVAARLLARGAETREKLERARAEAAKRETAGLTFQPDTSATRSGRATPAYSTDGGGGGVAAATARLWRQGLERRAHLEEMASKARVAEAAAERASMRRVPEISADSRLLAEQLKGA